MNIITIEIPTGKKRIPIPKGLKFVFNKKWMTESDYIYYRYLQAMKLQLARM